MTAATASPARTIQLARSRPVLLLGLLACASLLALALMSSIGFGAADIAAADVWAALVRFDPSLTEHLIIRTLRVPRAAVAALVGAALAVAGGLMQGLTRNPLADPGIIGISAGASLVAVTLIVVVKDVPAGIIPAAAFVGALVVAALIYVLAWKHGDSPIRLILVGISLGAIAGAATQLMITFGDLYDVQRALIWLTGSVYGRSWEEFWPLPARLEPGRALCRSHAGARSRPDRRRRPPDEVLTPALLEQVFGVRAHILTDPATGTPVCLPYAHVASADSAPKMAVMV